MRRLDDRQLGTVLAALRVYQRALELNGGLPPKDVEEIATNEGELDPLDIDEIDALCEELNVEETVSEAPGAHNVLREQVSGLVNDLDAIGFANEDAQVNGAATVDVLNRRLPALRDLIA